VKLSGTQQAQGRHFIFFHGEGGKILTNFLGGRGGAKYEKKSVCKNIKNPYFSKSGGGKMHPPLPPLNDVPGGHHIYVVA